MKIKDIKCFLFGHKPKRGLGENEKFLTKTVCSRCSALMFSTSLPHGGIYHKSIIKEPPPNSTREQKERWEKYCKQIENKFREDAKTLEGDWKAVGDDLRKAIKEFKPK